MSWASVIYVDIIDALDTPSTPRDVVLSLTDPLVAVWRGLDKAHDLIDGLA